VKLVSVLGDPAGPAAAGSCPVGHSFAGSGRDRAAVPIMLILGPAAWPALPKARYVGWYRRVVLIT